MAAVASLFQVCETFAFNMMAPSANSLQGVIPDKTYGAIFGPICLESASSFSDRKYQSNCPGPNPHPSSMGRAGHTCVVRSHVLVAGRESPLALRFSIRFKGYRLVKTYKTNRFGRLWQFNER